MRLRVAASGVREAGAEVTGVDRDSGVELGLVTLAAAGADADGTGAGGGTAAATFFLAHPSDRMPVATRTQNAMVWEPLIGSVLLL